MDEIEPNRLSGTAYAPTPGQVIVDQEFLEILKEDRAEKKDWIKKYESLLVDYKDKDKELVEREKFMHGLIEKIITDARNTKQLLASQINHLQRQLHAPQKNPPFTEAGEESEPEDGNFTETEKEGT